MKLAIFDIDNTLVRGDSFKRFCWFAVRWNGLRLYWLWRFAFDALTHPKGLFGASRFKKLCLNICLVNDDKAALTSLVKNFVEHVLLKKSAFGGSRSSTLAQT